MFLFSVLYHYITRFRMPDANTFLLIFILFATLCIIHGYAYLSI